jgi:hypothetical protein
MATIVKFVQRPERFKSRFLHRRALRTRKDIVPWSTAAPF